MIELINGISACDTNWSQYESVLMRHLEVRQNVSNALHAFNERGCDKVLLESLDGSNEGLKHLLGREVTWKEMGTYELHCLKKEIIDALEEQLDCSNKNCDEAFEGFFSNIRERIQLFMSFESERKECIKVLSNQADELTSEQKQELEKTKVSYATFDYKTAVMAVGNLKLAISLCNRYFDAIKKYANTPSENLSDMDREYIADMKEKLEATSISNEDASAFFGQLITKRVSGKSYKELGYNVSNLQSLANDVSRNVMNFYRQMSAMLKANERLGNAEAKRGNYGSSDLWDVYTNIFKILRDADRCYKTVEIHLFRTQQKIVRYVNANNKAAEQK